MSYQPDGKNYQAAHSRWYTGTESDRNLKQVLGAEIPPACKAEYLYSGLVYWSSILLNYAEEDMPIAQFVQMPLYLQVFQEEMLDSEFGKLIDTAFAQENIEEQVLQQLMQGAYEVTNAKIRLCYIILLCEVTRTVVVSYENLIVPTCPITNTQQQVRQIVILSQLFSSLISLVAFSMEQVETPTDKFVVNYMHEAHINVLLDFFDSLAQMGQQVFEKKLHELARDRSKMELLNEKYYIALYSKVKRQHSN